MRSLNRPASKQSKPLYKKPRRDLLDYRPAVSGFHGIKFINFFLYKILYATSSSKTSIIHPCPYLLGKTARLLHKPVTRGHHLNSLSRPYGLKGLIRSTVGLIGIGVVMVEFDGLLIRLGWRYDLAGLVKIFPSPWRNLEEEMRPESIPSGFLRITISPGRVSQGKDKSLKKKSGGAGVGDQTRREDDVRVGSLGQAN